MRVRFTPAAIRDIQQAVRWIRKDNRAAADGYRRAVQAVSGRIADHPLLGHLRPDLCNDRVRFMVVPGFPYLVVYEPHPPPPVILRVLHGARDLPAVLRGLEVAD